MKVFTDQNNPFFCFLKPQKSNSKVKFLMCVLLVKHLSLNLAARKILPLVVLAQA